MKLVSTNTVVTTNGITVFVYGKSGMGKTMLCATAPNPVILSTERGLLSLRKSNIPYCEVETLKELEENILNLLKSPFQTICIDSISAAADRELASCIPKHKNKMQAYGECQERIEGLMWKIQRCQGKNFYITAHLDQYQDETGMLMFGPSFPGKALNKSSPYIFDEVLYAHKHKLPDGKEVYALRSQATNTIEAKDRSGSLLELEPHDLTSIFNKITKG